MSYSDGCTSIYGIKLEPLVNRLSQEEIDYLENYLIHLYAIVQVQNENQKNDKMIYKITDNINNTSELRANAPNFVPNNRGNTKLQLNADARKFKPKKHLKK